MYRGEHVDILYGNVKHAFFQVKKILIFPLEEGFKSKRFVQEKSRKRGNCKKNE